MRQLWIRQSRQRKRSSGLDIDHYTLLNLTDHIAIYSVWDDSRIKVADLEKKAVIQTIQIRNPNCQTSIHSSNQGSGNNHRSTTQEENSDSADECGKFLEVC